MLSLEMLLLRNALTRLRDVNLEVQISWQAQRFVSLKCRLRGGRNALRTSQCRFRGSALICVLSCVCVLSYMCSQMCALSRPPDL